MRRVILDYLHRRLWVLVPGALVQIALGWAFARWALLSSDINPWGALQFQVSLWMGAMLLTPDLNRGYARALATLPLSTREIGRAWWLATVALPGVGLIGLLHLGAAAHQLQRASVAGWPWSELLITSVQILLVLSASFMFCITVPNPLDGPMFKRWLFSILSGGGVMLLVLAPLEHPLTIVAYVSLGATLGVIGFARRDRVANLPRSARSSDAAQSRSEPRDDYRTGGLCGLPRLLVGTSLRGLAMGGLILFLTPLAGLFIDAEISFSDYLRHALEKQTGMVWLFILMACMPATFQLRLLRTLPVSSSRIATTFLGMAILPHLVIGLLCAGIALRLPALDEDTTRRLVLQHLLGMGAFAIAVPVIVWLGMSMLGSALMIGLMIGAQIIPDIVTSFAPGTAWLWLTPCVALSLITSHALTVRILNRSRRVFRPRRNPYALAQIARP